MKRLLRIIIIGGNAAGPAAAAKAKRYNPNAEVLMFEAGEFISTGTCEMPYVLSGEIDDYRKIVFYSPESFMNEKRVKVFVNHFVEEIDSHKKQVVVKNLNEDKTLAYDYDRLILATGSKAKTLPGFDTQLRNVFTLKNVNDLIRLNKYISENSISEAVLIGSGYIGLETAEALYKRNIKVKLLERERLPLPTADEEFSEEILKNLNINNVEFTGNVKEIETFISADKLIAVKVDEKILKTDLAILSIGFEPDSFLARSAKIELGKHDGIKTDRYLKTSDRFIYSAGDNTEVINAVTGKPDYIPLAAHAYEMGHIAGENAAGGFANYDSVVKNIAVKIFYKYFASVGLTKQEAADNGFEAKIISAKARNLVSVMPGSDYVSAKVILDKNNLRILGASFIGGKEISGYADLLSALIKLKVPASALSKINYNYTPPLSPFINLLSIIGKQVK